MGALQLYSSEKDHSGVAAQEDRFAGGMLGFGSMHPLVTPVLGGFPAESLRLDPA